MSREGCSEKSGFNLNNKSIICSKFGITTAIIKQAAAEIRVKWGNKPIIFTIGRHVPYKGIEYLIKAEPLIKEDCVILIGGSGILTNHLKEIAQGRDRIKFIGFLPDKE